MTLKCIIVDDEPIARKVLEEFTEDVPWLELVGSAANPVSALALMNQHEIDLIFLDINMPKINGIEFLKTTITNASVIMTTAYAEYAVDAFGLNVLDYLVKPIPFDRFLKACTKAKDAAEIRQKAFNNSSPRDDHFFIKCENQLERVNFDELLYAEAMLNYVMLFTAAKKMIVYITIRSLEEQLPSELFIKVHKSFIVNRTKITSIEGNLLHIGDRRITISQGLREKVLDDIVKSRLIRR